MKTTTTEELKRVNMNIRRDLHDQFKSIAASRGESMTELVLQFIERYVKEHGPQRKKGER